MKAYSFGQLLPKNTSDYFGPRTVVAILVILNIVGTVRSLVHMFAPDSGAESIAGMDVTVAGGANVIALLAQWGGAQLLEALIIWAVIFRYRGLVPLMMLVVTVEQVFRKLIGDIKPLESAHTPPGAIGTDLLLPICVLAVIASLYVRRRFRTAAAGEVQ